MNGFDKELYVATVATATIIIKYVNDVAGVWDRVLQDYPNFFTYYIYFSYSAIRTVYYSDV